MNKIVGAIFGTFLFGLMLSLFAYGGRYITYRQTDPDDIVTRDRIDRQIDALFERFDREIQADTVLLVEGITQVVQLPNKYPDTDYQIFVRTRVRRGVATTSYRTVPTTDSSFTLDKYNGNVSTIQWMTIRK